MIRVPPPPEPGTLRDAAGRFRETPELLRRQRATHATLDKYRDRAFDWRGKATCVHLARFHLRQMGHRPEPLPRLTSEIAAWRALKARGWADVPAMLDTVLPRIAPARMLLGDLAVLPSDAGGMGAIMICAGPHKLLGWREDAAGLVRLDVTLDALVGSWRA